jgi:hypothetical protein
VFPFAGFLDDFLKVREGLAMLVLRSEDAEADRREFAEIGLGDFARFDFARKGLRDGREVEVAFSLAFARDAAFPDNGFFVCQQRFPENFWSKAAQVHPNGATGVASLTFTHPEPASAASFLSAFFDAPVGVTLSGLRLDAADANVECIRPQTYARREGADPPTQRGMAAISFAGVSSP